MTFRKRPNNWLDAANPNNPGYHKSYPYGTVWTWDYSDLEGAIPPNLASQWDLALASMGEKSRTTKVMAAIAATRIVLANAIKKVQGNKPTDGTISALRWVAHEAAGDVGKAAGTAIGAAAAAALAGPITAGVTAVSTAVGVTAAAGVEIGAGIALGAATAGIGALAVAAAIGIADAVVGAFDNNCCDHDSCDWGFDFRFGGGKEAGAGGLFGGIGFGSGGGSILGGGQETKPTQTFPDAKKIAWDHTLETFAYVVARLDWDAQAAIAKTGCPGPDLGAGPLLAACLLGAWNRANGESGLVWSTAQPAHMTYALDPNEPGGSTFATVEGFGILLIGLSVQHKLGGDDVVQFRVKGEIMSNDMPYSAAEGLDQIESDLEAEGKSLKNLQPIKMRSPLGPSTDKQPPHIRKIGMKNPNAPSQGSKVLPLALGGGGAAVGFAMGGPLGALVGGVLGAVVGSKAQGNQ